MSFRTRIDLRSITAKSIAASTSPFRLRHDTLGDLERTIIEADLDRDEAYEISITLIGNHTLTLHDRTA